MLSSEAMRMQICQWHAEKQKKRNALMHPWYITKENSARDKRNWSQYPIMYRTNQKENKGTKGTGQIEIDRSTDRERENQSSNVKRRNRTKVQYLDRSSYLLWPLRHYLLCVRVQLDTPRPSRPSRIAGGPWRHVREAQDGLMSRHLSTVRHLSERQQQSCLSKSPKRCWKKIHQKEHVSTKTEDCLKCVFKPRLHATMQSSSADHFPYPVIELS